ncbi:HAD family hydrolase [Kribbella sp. NPDC050820]|uniref:HAD family hydrolase n=1 Tax=Kribbella sp. NPDC050820 TaxID=3155408 RepID=UPI0033E45C57
MKALLVDLFSTLVPGGDAEREVVNQAMCEVLGVDAEAFTREFAATSYERFIGAYGDLPSTLRVIARRTGADPSDKQVLDATAMRRDLSRRLLSAAPAGTLAALEALRSADWRLGLVSNITSETQLQWAHSPLPPYFETTAFSAEVGAAKPEPKIYLAACNALEVEPTDCIYIGDGNDKELPGAAALGMHAIRTTEHSDSDPTWTGPTVRSFTELPSLIGAPA